MSQVTELTEAQRRWKKIKEAFFGDREIKVSEEWMRREAARRRWKFLRRTFVRSSVLQSISSRKDFAAVISPQLNTQETVQVKREPSVTALDSPYRYALTVLEDLDWQFNEPGRISPSLPTRPQFSTVRYQVNHEAFYDEVSGQPMAKVSTFGNSSIISSRLLPAVDEGVNRKLSVAEVYAERDRSNSLRPQNLRIGLANTIYRIFKTCLHPDVRL